MTLDELESCLPSGFHDSSIRGISVDYVGRMATIDWTVDLTTPEEPRREPGSADVTVVLRGLKYLVIEAPQADYPFDNTGPIDVVNSYDSSGSRASDKPLVNRALLEAAPHQKFANSFFVHNWNAFIHVAADEAELNWAREDAKTQ